MLESTESVNFDCGTSSERMKGNDYNFEFFVSLHNSQREQLKLFFDWSSYKERKGNALASGADEGRDKLR